MTDSRKLSVLLTSFWCFLGLLAFAILNVLYGINRAFAGFAVQQTDSAYDRIVRRIFEVLCLPDRVLPPPTSTAGNVFHIAVDLVWSFLLCVVVSAAYHAARGRFSNPSLTPNPNERNA